MWMPVAIFLGLVVAIAIALGAFDFIDAKQYDIDGAEEEQQT